MKLSDVPWGSPTASPSSFSRYADITLPGNRRLFVGERVQEPNTFCALTPDTESVVDLDALGLQALLFHYLGE